MKLPSSIPTTGIGKKIDPDFGDPAGQLDYNEV